MGYEFKSGKFQKIFGLQGNLVKRHNKGGYSANRFARIAEESRYLYVVRINNRLRETKNKENVWIFCSDEITGLVIKQSPIKLNNGGYINFNSRTISNTKHWLEILSKSKSNEIDYDKNYKEILEYLKTNIEMLDFEPNNKETNEIFYR